MSDGAMLAGLGLEDVPDSLPEGTYAGNVFDFKFIEKKDKSGRSAVMTYKVNDPSSPFHGDTIDRFQAANAHDTSQQKRFLKSMFTEIGVPESRLSTITKEDIVGTAVFFTVKKNGQYTNVSKVTQRDGASIPGAQGVAAPAATQPQSADDINALL